MPGREAWALSLLEGTITSYLNGRKSWNAVLGTVRLARNWGVSEEEVRAALHRGGHQ